MSVYTVRIYQIVNDAETSHRCGMPGEVWSTAGEAFDWALTAFRACMLDGTGKHPIVGNFSKFSVLSDDHAEIFSLVNHLAD